MSDAKQPLSWLRRNSGMLLAVLVASVIALALFAGGVSVHMDGNELHAGATLAGERAVPWEDVLSVTYVENPDWGQRRFGVLGWRIHAGTYVSDAWGVYQLYAYARVNACVDGETKNGHVVFNAKTADETHALYDEALGHISAPS